MLSKLENIVAIIFTAYWEVLDKWYNPPEKCLGHNHHDSGLRSHLGGSCSCVAQIRCLCVKLKSIVLVSMKSWESLDINRLRNPCSEHGLVSSSMFNWDAKTRLPGSSFRFTSKRHLSEHILKNHEEKQGWQACWRWMWSKAWSQSKSHLCSTSCWVVNWKAPRLVQTTEASLGRLYKEAGENSWRPYVLVELQSQNANID